MKRYYHALSAIVLTSMMNMSLQAQDIDPMSDTWVCNDVCPTFLEKTLAPSTFLP